MITNKQKELLLEAWQYCDDEDKSTEFMLQYMSDVAEVDFDEVVDFVRETTDDERIEFNKSENGMNWEKFNPNKIYPNGMYVIKLSNGFSPIIVECFHSNFMLDFEVDDEVEITNLFKLKEIDNDK